MLYKLYKLYKLYMLSDIYTSPVSLDLASRMMT